MRIFWGQDVGKREKEWDEDVGKARGKESIENPIQWSHFFGPAVGGAGTERHRAKTIVEFWPVLVFSGDYLYDFSGDMLRGIGCFVEKKLG